MTRLSAATRPTEESESVFLHASSVETPGGTFLFLGKPGSGKSQNVISYIQRGGCLIADDYVRLELNDSKIYVEPAEKLKGLIERRGIGVARVPFTARAVLSEIILLERYDKSSLPEWILNCASVRISHRVAA